MKNKYEKYRTVIIGAGAAGLYCASMLKEAAAPVLILEKNKQPGRKLLMAGGGQCNLTHGGSIKDFISHYGDNGRLIRGVLQRHSNMQLAEFLEKLGVNTIMRDDGKVFPASMDGRDVLTALIREISNRKIHLKCEKGVTDVKKCRDGSGFRVETGDEVFQCENIVVATGGCSYPSTGSDGSMLRILRDGMCIDVKTPRPALTPVFVKDYRYGSLSGISFRNIGVTIHAQQSSESDSSAAVRKVSGDLLFTERNLSGPVILNSSRYMTAGDTLCINYLYPASGSELAARFRADFPGNGKSPRTYMSDELGLPKRFSALIEENLGIKGRKVSQLSGGDMARMAEALTSGKMIIEELSGFREAMVTAGGVSPDEISRKTMESIRYKGMYIIGEALNVDGDTGGYNLQFAYSSAASAAEALNNSLCSSTA